MSGSYRPRYHASVPSGWANDPNGTIYYQGKAHLFYQHYPHKAEWGTMHWGHFATKDFVQWENLPIALVPDQEYEEICGCCSGSAIEKDGKLYLMYTAAQPDLQRQCMAVSEDGVHFTKDPNNPIITAQDISPEIFKADFRDPRMFKKGDMYYLIAGARWIDPDKPKAASRNGNDAGKADRDAAEAHSPSWGSGVSGVSHVSHPVSPSLGVVSGIDPERDGYGNLVLLKSPDLFHWEYVGHLIYPQEEFDPAYYALNGVYECPDYFTAEDGTEVLLSSPQNLPAIGNLHQNIHSGMYMLGKLDFDTGRFTVDIMGELDSGFDFYAAQSLRTPDGRVVMIAWKEMWDRTFPTQAENWAGTYTLPRELTVKGNRLIQKPVRELEAYRKNPVSVKEAKAEDGEITLPGVSGTVAELRFTLEPGTASRAGVKVFCGKEHETAVYYDAEKGLLIFDRSKSGLPLKGSEKDVNRRVLEVGRPASIDLWLFLDVNSLEVFVDGGRSVMTGNVYPDLEKDDGIRFFSEGGESTFRNIEKFDIAVPAPQVKVGGKQENQ